MIKTMQRIIAEEKEKYSVPKSVQIIIPIRRIWADGIFLCANKYVKSYRFSDINYRVSSPCDKEEMFGGYCELINTLDSSADTKITISNRRIDKIDFENNILLREQGDDLNFFRREYNEMLTEKAIYGSGIVQEKYITISVVKKNVGEARTFFNRCSSELSNRLHKLSSHCEELGLGERMRILYDFYRCGEESDYYFDYNETLRKGHHFKDQLCPSGAEFHKDYFMLGKKYGRSLFLRDYASYIKDSMMTELCEMSKTLMISVTLNPVPTEEAIREVENRLLGVETNITNWQRRQNQNNNFSAVIPYDMEQQRKEAKEFLDDLTARDQKMLFAVVTMVHLADTKEELDTDTETILATGRKYLSQISTLTYQQMDGLTTTLPLGIRKINAFRTLTTESAAAVAMPFSAQEISQRQGIYYGQNMISKNMILANRKLLQNGNSFILGVSGSGKSFTAKKEILNIILSGLGDVIVVDPEREYSSLIQSMGGEIIHISATSNNHINALDINKEYGDGANPVILKSEFILSLCELLIGNKAMGAKEKSLIDRCSASVLRKYISSGYKGSVPTMKEFHEELLKQNEPEATDIALALELFVNGSLNTFAQTSNVDVDSHILCYDILDLGKQLLPIGMLVVLDNIFNRITKNRAEGRNTFIFIDEIYLLFQHEYSANFLSILWKRVRKYGAFCTGITQNIDDLMQNHTARTMLANSEFVIMLNQAPTDRERLASLLNISELQLSYITNADIGSGLMKVGSALVPFSDNFPHNTLYKLMTTKFGE